MRKFRYVLITGVVFSLASCGNDVKEDQSNSDSTHQEHNHDDQSIELDNGKKWIVVDEMMGHIKNMESDLDNFESQAEKDYQSLAVQLEENINLLISNCTMTGKAHDELHKWLLPYIEIVDELADAKNDELAAVAYRKIQESFSTFNTHFK